MRHHKTLIWTVAVMAFFSFAAAPAAQAFVYPLTAALTLAAVIGAGGLAAEEVVEPDQEKTPDLQGEKPSPSAAAQEMAAESAGRSSETD